MGLFILVLWGMSSLADTNIHYMPSFITCSADIESSCTFKSPYFEIMYDGIGNNVKGHYMFLYAGYQKISGDAGRLYYFYSKNTRYGGDRLEVRSAYRDLKPAQGMLNNNWYIKNDYYYCGNAFDYTYVNVMTCPYVGTPYFKKKARVQ